MTRSMVMLSWLALAACADQAPAQQVLVLGELDAAGEVVGEIADRFDVVTAEEGLDWQRVTAVALDLDTLTRDDLAAERAMLQQARSAGVPVLLTNIRDHVLASEVLGFSVPSDAALYTFADGVTQVRVYGSELGELGEETEGMTSVDVGLAVEWDNLSPAEQEDAARTLGVPLAELKAELQRAKQGDVDQPEAQGAADTSERDVTASVIKDLAASALPSAERIDQSTLGHRQFHRFEVEMAPSQRTLNNQTARLEKRFAIDMTRDTDTGERFVSVATAADMGGAWPTTTSLTWNDGGHAFANGHVGWFQDEVTYRTTLLTSGGLRSHTPSAPQSLRSYVADLDCGYATGTFECYPGQYVVDLDVWGVQDITYGNNAGWSFRMEESKSTDYEEPSDLADLWWGGLHEPSYAATTVLGAGFEAVWTVPGSESPRVQLDVSETQRLVHVWTRTRWFWQNVYWSTVEHRASQQFTVDFSAVL